MTLIQILEFALPVVIVIATLEALVLAFAMGRRYNWRAYFASLADALGRQYIVLPFLPLSLATPATVYARDHHLFTVPINTVAAVAVLVIIQDFSYYWFHRVSHECRLFWASHVVHHSSQRYNLSTALRQTWTGSFMSFIFWIWLPIVGFPPVMIMTMKAISLLYQFWIHTELIRSLGPFEAVLNTPSHHRVHHGSNPRYIDRNHGGTLIIWDKLFGTFEPENPADPVRFGLTKNIHTYNPVRIAFQEWAEMFRDAWRAPGWNNKARYIFGNPGWHHEQL